MPRPSAEAPFRFAISATFTAEPLAPVLEFWARRLDTDVEVRFAPYHQVDQTLLDPRSVFGANRHGLNVILLRLEDLGPLAGDPAGGLERIEANLRRLAARVLESRAELAAPLLVCLCPSRAGDPAWQARLAADLASALGQAPPVAFLSAAAIDARYPVEAPHDAEAERLARIPYTELYFAALGTAIVRHANALSMRPYKVIALDCDNTLWSGLCGEDGPEGVALDAPRRALQEFMAQQREAGMLLAMASKNNQQDVLETFSRHPEMPLQLRHFAAWRINWGSKTDNLTALAAELSLGLDSFIFVDDNPKECAEVAERLPEVLALALPENISGIQRFLRHVWAFDHPALTGEDRNRSASYQQVREFGREARSAANLEQFLASLELRVSIAPLSPGKLARVAQLTERTNQFNVTTIRRTQAEIAALVREGSAECWTVEVADRFGAYGLTGVVIFETRGAGLDVDTLLLSCRVLGRGVEHHVLERLAEAALARGLAWVSVPLVPTGRNAPARLFLEAVGAKYREQTEAGLLFRFPARALAGLSTRAALPAAAGAPLEAEEARPRPSVARRSVDFAGIAGALAAPADILAALRRERQAAHQPAPEMSGVERQLELIWSELLARPVVDPSGNFFDLGGHSLLAVQLLLRIRESFGVELTLDDVYAASVTLASLAARIEAAEFSRLHPDEYRAVVAEIEGLSDDQVRELLARETDAV